MAGRKKAGAGEASKGSSPSQGRDKKQRASDSGAARKKKQALAAGMPQQGETSEKKKRGRPKRTPGPPRVSPDALLVEAKNALVRLATTIVWYENYSKNWKDQKVYRKSFSDPDCPADWKERARQALNEAEPPFARLGRVLKGVVRQFDSWVDDLREAVSYLAEDVLPHFRLDSPEAIKEAETRVGMTLDELQEVAAKRLAAILGGFSGPVVNDATIKTLRTPRKGKKLAACSRVGEVLGVGGRMVQNYLSDMREPVQPVDLSVGGAVTTLGVFLEAMGVPKEDRLALCVAFSNRLGGAPE